MRCALFHFNGSERENITVGNAQLLPIHSSFNRVENELNALTLNVFIFVVFTNYSMHRMSSNALACLLFFHFLSRSLSHTIIAAIPAASFSAHSSLSRNA